MEVRWVHGYLEVGGGDEPLVLLTPRERDVLVALCAPLLADEPFPQPASVRTVAAALVVSEAAVKQHLANLYDKFRVDERGDRRRRLATEALRRGAIEGAPDLTTRARTTVPGGSTGFAGAAAPDPADLEAGRRACAGRAWATAVEAFDLAAARGPLAATDLDRLAEALRWSGQVDRAIQVRQSAHQAALAADDAALGALTAVALAIDHILILRGSAVGSWLQAARRLADEAGDEHVQGIVAVTFAIVEVATGAAQAGLDHARAAHHIGRRTHDVDLQTLGLTFQGLALVHLGHAADGLLLLDEAMAYATGGGLGPLATGLTYCRTLSAWLELFDYRRAMEWSETILRRGPEIGTIGFPGDCHAHRATVLIVGGQWEAGEREVLAACQETPGLDLNHAALAYYQLGELRLRQGDLDAAEASFRHAHELGADPHPGLAVLLLARGDAAAAAAALRTSLAAAATDPLRRARLLPAHVEVALAEGDLATAEAAVIDLNAIAHAIGGMAIEAAAACARGATCLARGDPDVSATEMRIGVHAWLEVGAPFEAAQARLVLADALDATGDHTGARLEASAARTVFERLGARRAMGLAAAREGARPAGGSLERT